MLSQTDRQSLFLCVIRKNQYIPIFIIGLTERGGAKPRTCVINRPCYMPFFVDYQKNQSIRVCRCGRCVWGWGLDQDRDGAGGHQLPLGPRRGTAATSGEENLHPPPHECVVVLQLLIQEMIYELAWCIAVITNCFECQAVGYLCKIYHAKT